jgi:hypothetical protein
VARTVGSAHHNAPWPDSTTTAQVMTYATGEFSNAIILLAAAERSGDIEAMGLHCKKLRHIVTRIDAFRRLRVRQWRVQPASSQKTTSDLAPSGT